MFGWTLNGAALSFSTRITRMEENKTNVGQKPRELPAGVFSRVQGSASDTKLPRMFEQAVAFRRVMFLAAGEFGERLEKGATSGNPAPAFALQYPIGVLTAFSIELAFKCILGLENYQGKIRTHDLHELFTEKISENGQKRIDELYHEIVDNHPMYVAMKKTVPDKDYDLRKMLGETAEAFERWRYAFEKEFLCPQPCRACIDAAINYILELKPEYHELVDWSASTTSHAH